MATGDAARRREGDGPGVRKAREGSPGAQPAPQHAADFGGGESIAGSALTEPQPLDAEATTPLCAFCGERDADFRVVSAGRLEPSCTPCNEDWVETTAAEERRRAEIDRTPEMPERDDVDF